MKEYKKSYLGLILWLLGMILLLILCCFFKNLPLQLWLAIVDNSMTVSLFILTWVIYLTESVYWYTGISFEEAKEAGSERRKKFAVKYMKRFGIFGTAFLIYSLISVYFGFPYAEDIVIALTGIVGVAISTVKIKL